MGNDLYLLLTRANYRQVLHELIRRDLRSRYKVSVLGFFWSLLRPFLSILVIYIVFSKLVGFEMDLGLYPKIGYFAFLAFGYLPWVYFSSCLNEGAQALLANSHLIKKVYCPRAIFPLTTVGAQLVNFILALLVFIPLLWFFSEAQPSLALAALPLVILFQTLFIAGLVLALSALNVLYRDVGQMLEFVTMAWFYLTPVLYPIHMPLARLEAVGIPGGALWLNPMATITFWYRWTCLGRLDTGHPLTQSLVMGTVATVVLSIAVFWGGYALYKRLDIPAVDEL